MNADEHNITQEYKGFSLFTDIENIELRNRNRAVILANIAENHSKNRKISPGGAGLILGYFKNIPDDEKNDVQQRFVQQMNQRGFHVTH